MPHDFAISCTEDFYRDALGFYRTVFPAPKAETRHMFLCFDGVYMDSTLFVNGQCAGEWKYGYSAFQFDIFPFMTQPLNEVVLRICFKNPNSRWYSGAGIFREVTLYETGENYLPLNGTYLHSVKQNEAWLLHVRTEAAGGDHVILSIADKQLTLPVQNGIAEGEIQLSGIRVWDISDPFLYPVKIGLIKDGLVCDEDHIRYGFREAVFTPDRGFLLNGRPVKLHGVCLHHDLGALGAAYNRAASLRQLNLMKRMGVNAVRTSHNMPAKQMMDLCDELGLLVDSEAFDMWGLKKTDYDYARFFDEWMPKDVESWIRRDRNRPSVILWSMGNEIYDTHADENGMEEMLRIEKEVRRHDPLVNAPVTIGSNYMPWENTRKCADRIKLIGYNYAERLYEEDHRTHPDWMIYGSETSSLVQSRGIYHFPASENILAEDDLQCSSLNNSGTSWGAKSVEYCILMDRDTPFCAGQFLWSGTDYLGEPTPYHTKNSYFGMADTAGFEKDIYSVFRAAWSEDHLPFIHLWPAWDYNEGQLIDVFTVTNQMGVRLYLNGKAIGQQATNARQGHVLQAHFIVPYEKGVLEARALDENGNETARDERRSFTDAVKLIANADKSEMLSDGQDMIFITITAEDPNGCPVENAVNRVQVKVEGAARLMALDNGDSTDMDPFPQDHRRMFSGKLLAMLRSDGTDGEIRLTCTSPGLESANLTLHALPCNEKQREGIGLTERARECSPVTEIPIRKIELTFPDGTELTPEKKQVRVLARVLPENADPQPLFFRITNDRGIDSVQAEVTPTKEGAVLTGRFDGSFRVRCMANNRTDHACVISQMEMRCSGMGEARLDPYQFVSCGLKDRDNGCITAGNERGVATMSDTESVFGFSAVDFGAYGSDEVTIPIFTLNNGSFPFEIFDGDPAAGGKCVCRAVYCKPSIWNVYQEDTFRLTQRLQGIHSLYFVTHDKMHFKGFTFRFYDRAYAPLDRRDYLSIYGDTFTEEGTRVCNIGNNVSIDLGELDFGEKGPDAVILRGRSLLPVNTLHLRFSGKNGTEDKALPFEQTEEDTERIFPLSGIREKQNVQLVFLPGSRFDLNGLQFISSSEKNDS